MKTVSAKRVYLLLTIAFLTSGLYSQNQNIGIGTTSPSASALVHMASTSKGLLVPRMTTAQRIAIGSPANGLLVYDNTTDSFFYFKTGIGWIDLSPVLMDADADTKIQVEETPDDDMVRIDIAGTERLILRQNASGSTLIELPNNGDDVYLGTGAGLNNTSGDNNTAVGKLALSANTSSGDNTALGAFALTQSTGAQNTGLGAFALGGNTIASENTGVGYLSLGMNTAGIQNTAVGALSLRTSNGHENTAIGYKAMFGNTTGPQNTACGNFALQANTVGDDNCAFGYNALAGNIDGHDNSAVGRAALFANTSGSENVAFGRSTLGANTTGSNNTAIGRFGMGANTTGTSNTTLGFQTDVASGNLTNATAIGAFAEVSASNCLVLGSINGVNGGTATVNVGIGVSAPVQRLQVNGNVYASGGDLYTNDVGGVINAGCGIANADINIISDDSAPTILNANGDEDLYIEDDLELGSQGYKPGGGSWGTASDARLKKDITPFNDGLVQVLQINPVRYRYNDLAPFHDKDRQYVGVIAQQIEEIAPYMVELMPMGQKVKEDENGTEHIVDPGTLYYTYDATALTYMLVNAIKEQQQIISDDQVRILQLEKENEKIRKENADILAQLDKIVSALHRTGIDVN